MQLKNGLLDDKTMKSVIEQMDADLKDGKQEAGERLVLDSHFLEQLMIDGEFGVSTGASEMFFGSHGISEGEERRQQLQKTLKNMYFVLNAQGNHWILIHVRRRRQSRGEIWIIDSLHGPLRREVTKLMDFLTWFSSEETYHVMNWDVRYGSCPLPAGFPSQNDGVSCGVYVALYFEHLVRAEEIPVTSVNSWPRQSNRLIQNVRDRLAEKYWEDDGVENSVDLLWSAVKPRKEKVKLCNLFCLPF